MRCITRAWRIQNALNYGSLDLLQRTSSIFGMKTKSRLTTSIAVFQMIQAILKTVLEEHLKAAKGKLLVSKFESDQDAQIIFYKRIRRFWVIHCCNTTFLSSGVEHHTPFYCFGKKSIHRTRNSSGIHSTQAVAAYVTELGS
jgi:hypothetical protein